MICDLCGYHIYNQDFYDTHGYGECVEMPDNFMSPFFDEMRHRRVAIIKYTCFSAFGYDPKTVFIDCWFENNSDALFYID